MVNMEELILVTGASGYVGSHIVKLLLEKGYKVRGTVRNVGDGEKYKWLKNLETKNPGTLDLCSVDVLDFSSVANVIRDAVYVIHCAAVVKYKAKDPQNEIVKVAVEGTRNVINAILKFKTCKKLVITSSIAAVVGGKKMDEVCTESDWNFKYLNLDYPYHMAKTKAEMLAWEIYGNQPMDGYRFELVTIQPGYALGPILHESHIHSSAHLVQTFLNGSMPAVLNAFFSLVDVRDIALSHVRAIERKEASGRFLVVHRNALHAKEIAKILKEKYPKKKIPSNILPNSVFFLVVPFQPSLTLKLAKLIVSQKSKFDSSKAEKVLGIELKSTKETLVDTAETLINYDLI